MKMDSLQRLIQLPDLFLLHPVFLSLSDQILVSHVTVELLTSCLLDVKALGLNLVLGGIQISNPTTPSIILTL